MVYNTGTHVLLKLIVYVLSLRKHENMFAFSRQFLWVRIWNPFSRKGKPVYHDCWCPGPVLYLCLGAVLNSKYLRSFLADTIFLYLSVPQQHIWCTTLDTVRQCYDNTFRNLELSATCDTIWPVSKESCEWRQNSVGNKILLLCIQN